VAEVHEAGLREGEAVHSQAVAEAAAALVGAAAAPDVALAVAEAHAALRRLQIPAAVFQAAAWPDVPARLTVATTAETEVMQE